MPETMTIATRDRRAYPLTRQQTATVFRFIGALDSNVDDFYRDLITYEQFCATQRSLWDAIHAESDTIESAVLHVLRSRSAGNLNG